MPMMDFGAMPVITSLYLTDPHEQVVVRPWRERLFSWPWRPFVRTRTVIVQVPSRRIFQDDWAWDAAGSLTRCADDLAALLARLEGK